ncbi:CAP domain-containing protein [candidate division WOR-3 bacterium]|nr:CAP domain-containing protein [candidate division WOR-3 bacterium]
MPILLLILNVSLAEIRVDALLDTTVKLVSLYPEIEGNDSIEALIFRLTNRERNIRGLKNLKFDDRLRIAARQHSNDMLKKRYLSHTSSMEISKTPLQRIYNSGLPVLGVGENVAENIGDAVPFLLKSNPDSLVKLVMKKWMESPAHRKNILNPEFSHMGIGSVAEGRMHKITQNFANESAFEIDSVLAKVELNKYLLFFYMSSKISDIRIFNDGEPLVEDSVYIYSGLIGIPLKRDSSLHKVELCLKEKQFYRCGVRLFIHTGSPVETIFQPSSSRYK